jgi:hypothetical protein
MESETLILKTFLIGIERNFEVKPLWLVNFKSLKQQKYLNV